eukprot:365555-Chlamydomonas_euryale.AAC.15
MPAARLSERPAVNVNFEQSRPFTLFTLHGNAKRKQFKRAGLTKRGRRRCRCAQDTYTWTS